MAVAVTDAAPATVAVSIVVLRAGPKALIILFLSIVDLAREEAVMGVAPRPVVAPRWNNRSSSRRQWCCGCRRVLFIAAPAVAAAPRRR